MGSFKLHMEPIQNIVNKTTQRIPQKHSYFIRNIITWQGIQPLLETKEKKFKGESNAKIF